MAKVVFMERSDQAGAFQKVMRTAETEIDSFGASGSGPMHEKLRAAYDRSFEGPGSRPRRCFALAWNGLSLSDQDQVRVKRRANSRNSWPRRRGFVESVNTRQWAQIENNHETRTSLHFF